MDATRIRRTRDHARQRWYAQFRSYRFARHLGFAGISRPPEKAASPNARLLLEERGGNRE